MFGGCGCLFVSARCGLPESMACIEGRQIGGQASNSLRETARVDGEPKVVSPRHLVAAEGHRRRCTAPGPASSKPATPC